MALAAATRLGPYEILGLIGSGGMGEVYKAKDTRLDRTVAIKVLPSEISSDPDRRARFEREAKTIATLSHPHICTLYDVGEHASSLFLVLEHLEGQTLADRLHRGALSIEQALEIGAQIAEALSAAHRAGIIHRDLKPANVMLTKSGVKLLDFGLAKLAPQADAIPGVSAITHSKPLTAQRMIVGTLQYMAPEQLEAKEVDARTDIWALGLVLYEMVTGKAAFAANSEAGLIAAILERQPSPLTSIQPLTPGSLQRLVVRCLAKNPDQRWDSTHDVADELRWIAGAGTADAHVPVAPVHSRLRRVALLLGVVVMVTGAAALWLTGVGRFAPAATPIRSIAVLPLENLSHDEAQEFFTDGLTDALITELGHIKALRVISRTSVMRYKNTRKTVAEISNELNGVGAFLEGTVMRAGDRVAITIQLVDAARDQQLWSQSYERSVSDILGLRREIAQTVAHEIRIATAGDQGSARGVRKVNPAAYEQYLRAITAESAGDTEQTARRALAAAREAVRLDPGFALAYAALSEANGKLWWYHWDHSSARAEEARGAADRALELDADSGEAHRAKGAVYYFIDLNYAKALAEFNAALERNPNDSIALSNIGYVQRRQGRQDEAVRTLEQAIQLNPVDATLFFNLGETYALVRRPEDADRSYDRAIALSSYSRPFAYKLRWRLRVRPEFKEAREIERRAESAGFGADPILMYHRVMLHIFSGDSRTSLQLLAASGVEAFEEQFWYVPRTLLQGQAYEAIGDRLQARASYAEARRLLTEKLAHDWQDSRYHSALGVVLAALGDAPGALREGKAGTDLMPVTREAYRGVYRLEDLARIYALTGQRDAAVETLRRVLTIPDDLSAAGVLIDPAFERLRGYPPFENLIASPSRRSGQFSESLELVRGTEAKVPGK